MREPDPRILDTLRLNKRLRRQVEIKWHPMRRRYSVTRHCDATVPRIHSAAYFASIPCLKTNDWFEVCCYAMSGHRRKGKTELTTGELV